VYSLVRRARWSLARQVAHCSSPGGLAFSPVWRSIPCRGARLRARSRYRRRSGSSRARPPACGLRPGRIRSGCAAARSCPARS